MKFPILMMLLTFLLSACQENKQQEQAAQPPMQSIPARVEHPQVKELVEWVEFTGRFQAQQHVEVRARVSGYLEDIKFEDGQIVQKGDALFVIDQRPFKIALASAQAQFEAANNEYKRTKGLRNSKAISEETYDARLQAMRMAKAALDEAKLNLEFTEVKAPITGRISNNRIDVGNLVDGNLAVSATLLTTIVSIAPIEFYFEASETDLLQHLRNRDRGVALAERGIGLPVFVKLQDETEFLHEGKINFADNALSQDTGTILVRAIFDNKKRLFEPGMFARMRIARGLPDEKIIVPQQIIGTEQVRKYVYVLNDENKATRQYVTLGDVTSDGMQIVRKGLTKNDRVIVGGLHLIQPGVSVTPIESNPDNTASKQQNAH